MTFFESWRDRGMPRLPKLPKEVVSNLDRYDKQDFDRMMKEMAAFAASKDKLTEHIPQSAFKLTGDVFSAFQKVTPRFRHPQELDPNYRINGAVMDEAKTLPEYERLKEWTEGDPVAAAGAFISLEPDLETVVDKLKKQQQQTEQLVQQMQQIQDAMDEQRSVDQMLEDALNAEEPSDEEIEAAQQRKQELQDQIDQMMADAEALDADIDNGLDQQSSGIRSTLRSKMGQIADDMEATAAAAQAWGLDRGALQKMDPNKRMELAQKLNTAKFKKISDLWGPMSRLMFTEQTRKTMYSPEEVFDVTLGNDLWRVLPAEFAALDDEVREWEFYRRFLEGELLTYEMQGTEKVGKGGIIFCTDNSGSMAGDPEVWAKALGLCTLHLAREQKREFFGIHFSDRSSIKTFDFRRPEDFTIDKALEYASHFFNGGPLRVDQRVVTPTGWQEIGTLVPGDKVFGPDGKPVAVLGVYPQGILDLWTVTFKDGAKVVCDGSHLWTVLDRGVSGQASKQAKPRTASLSELMSDGLECKFNGFRFSVPISDPVELPARHQLLDPYLLGYLLGNGGFTHSSPTVTPTPGDEHPWESLLPPTVAAHDVEKRAGFAPSFLLTSGPRGGGRINPLTEALRAFGLWGLDHATKFIPEDYLWGSIEQRWSLFQGLCDSDGSFGAPGSVEYGTVSEKLAGNVVELVQSLGGVATLSVMPPRRANEQTFHRVHAILNGDRCPFRLQRKAAQWQSRHHDYIRSIVSAERTMSSEAVCILVDRADGLFLTEGFVVTHNTDFQRPLSEALTLLEKEYADTGAVKGDIIFVTDDQCGVDPGWLKSFKERQEILGFKVWGIAVGAHRRTEPLNSICDGKVCTVQDIISGEDVREMFREL